MANEDKKKQVDLERESLDLAKKLLGVEKNIAQEIRDTNNVINDQIKLLNFQIAEKTTLRKISRELQSIAEATTSVLQEELGTQKFLDNLDKNRAKVKKDILILEDIKAKALNGEIELEKEIQDQIDAQISSSNKLLGTFKNLEDTSKEISNNFNVKAFAGLEDLTKSIPGLKVFSEPFKEAADESRQIALNNKLNNKTNNVFLGGLKKLGPAIRTAFKPLIGLEILMALGQADKELVEVQRNLALSKIEAIGFRAELAEAAASSGNINVTTTALLKTFNAINKELGFQGKFNSQNLVTATRLLDVVGLTEQSTANLTAAAEIRGNLLEDEYKTILATSYELQRQTGVQFSNKEILEAVGQVTGQVRANLGANPSAIAAAVTQAKLFGAELDDIVGASKALLDFESSIRNELEAELLLGRNLSLERARLAALTGDQSTLAAELSKNAQDFGTFTKLNVIQQDALASALGLQSDQLADILFKQEVQGKTAKELRALGKNELADRLEAQTLQDKFTKSVEKLKSVLVDVVSAFTPILDILGGALELVGKIIQGINSISPALSGALVGAGTGALIGGAPGALIGGAIGLAGGVINTSTSSTTLSSPSVSIGSNQDALKKEVQGMRMAFEKYAEKGTELKVSATNFNNKQKVYAYSV